MKARSSSSKNGIINMKGKSKSIYTSNPNPTSTNLTLSISMNLQDPKHINKQKYRHNNFIQANKQNLHNFFKDRIPKQKIVLGQKHVLISPTKIFKLRKQQYLKQQQTTKFILQNSCQMAPLVQVPSTKKMNKTFLINSKSKQLTINNNTVLNSTKWVRLGGSTSTYQTPTSSSMGKRSQITKKKAYISVFGDKLFQQKSKLLEVQSFGCLSLYQNQNSKQKQRAKTRPKTNLTNSKNQQQRQKLSSLISRIEGFAKQINPNLHMARQHQQIFQKQHQFEYQKQLQKGELIDWIKSISNNYKKKNQEIQICRMKTVQDIQKMDPNFYSKMKTHKNYRLMVRNKALDSIKFGQNMKDQRKTSSFLQYQSSRQVMDEKQNEDWIDKMLTITDRNNHTIQQSQSNRQNQLNQLKVSKLTYRQKLKNFGQNLIQTTNLAKLYSVKIHNIFIAFWKKRKPFQLQGSYGFFKYIKIGDFQKVENFVIKNIEYAYQIDHEYRTTLIYAVQNSHIKIVKYLIDVGINIDAKALNGFTAIYYALIKNNYKMVECLLKAGASPWSTQNYSINQLISQSSEEIQIIIKNARKIHIAHKLIRKITEKQLFWATNKHKIQGNQLIIFQ